MVIDLTKPGGATLAEVRQLLASKDDSQNRQLRVDNAGQAFLSDQVGAENIANLCFRFETWSAGNGYSGKDASENRDWVSSVCNDLNANWPNPKSTYIDW